MTVPVPTIASRVLRKSLDSLPDLGIDPLPLLAEAGIDPQLADDVDGRIPLPALHTFWEALLRYLPYPEAVIVGAQRYTPGDYGLVGFVSMNSATLGEGLRHAVRYLQLWADEPGMRFEEDGTLEVVYRVRFPDRLGVRCATESALVEVLHGARLLTGKPLAPREVCFSHAAPADVSGYESFFGAPVRFGQPTTAMRLEPAELAAPLPRADPQLGEFLRRLANDALVRRGAEADAGPFADVRRLIAEELQRGVPAVAQIARRLAVSERTLRRRLAEQATSFRELVDVTRAEIARTYVRERKLPLSEVAFLLGFSEPSAFHRAFKRWMGCTPAEYRLAAR